jgi:plasmid stability protein
MAMLTLRNVPDALVARLKERAKRHRRSLNNETIAALELADAVDAYPAGFGMAQPVQPLWDREAALARIRAIQAHFPGAARAAELDQRTPEEIQAELDHFAELRSHFKGPALTSEEIIAAIGRDSHPRELEPMDPVDRPQP